MSYTPKTWTSLYTPAKPEPSPNHPAYAATPGPRRLEGEHHRVVARKIGAASPLLPSEGSEHYWQRIGGRYLDTYIEARREAYRVALKREHEHVANVLREQASLDNICRGMDDD